MTALALRVAARFRARLAALDRPGLQQKVKKIDNLRKAMGRVIVKHTKDWGSFDDPDRVLAELKKRAIEVQTLAVDGQKQLQQFHDEYTTEDKWVLRTRDAMKRYLDGLEGDLADLASLIRDPIAYSMHSSLGFGTPPESPVSAATHYEVVVKELWQRLRGTTTIAMELENKGRKTAGANLDVQQRRLDALLAIRDELLGSDHLPVTDEYVAAAKEILQVLSDNPVPVLLEVLDKQLDKLAKALEDERNRRLAIWKENRLPEAVKVLRRAYPQFSYWSKRGMHRFYYGDGEDSYLYLDLNRDGEVQAFQPQRSRRQQVRIPWLAEFQRKLDSLNRERAPAVLLTEIR